MDNETARIIGGMYIAITNALSEEGAQVAHDCLYGFADNPNLRPEDRRIYQLIADAASRDVETLRAENAWLDRPRLRVVGGTAQ